MLLLDTNAFIWFVGDEDTLSEEIRAEIETNEHIFVSIATFCEMAIKHCKGLLELSNTITELMEICGRLRNSVLQIQINGLHLDVVSQLPLIHKDPFDRLIICQAKVGNLRHWWVTTRQANHSPYPYSKHMLTEGSQAFPT